MIGPRKRRILVTGGLGYLGSALVRCLGTTPDPWRVRILDNLHRPAHAALMGLPEGSAIEFLEGDILDPAATRRALEGVHAVVHLAALVRTPFSFDYPEWTEQVNHWGTARLVEQCLDAGVERFILASSTSVYGPGENLEETDACKPVGPYSRSKRSAEDAVMTAQSRGFEPSVLRIATVFGDAPSVRFDAVPNRFAYLAGVGRPLVVEGTGEQMRPVIHVADVCDAIVHVLEMKVRDALGVFNVVAENVSVLEAANVVHGVRGNGHIRFTAQDVLSHVSISVHGRKLESTGWRPHHTLREGMKEIIDRFRGVSVPPMTQEDAELKA